MEQFDAGDDVNWSIAIEWGQLPSGLPCRWPSWSAWYASAAPAQPAQAGTDATPSPVGDSRWSASVEHAGFELDPAARPELQGAGHRRPGIRALPLRLGKVYPYSDFWRLNDWKPVFTNCCWSDGDIALIWRAAGRPDRREEPDQQRPLLRFLLTQLSTFDIHDTAA